MREIKFRGRYMGLPSCWVYGYYAVINGHNFIINQDGQFGVSPEKVGQFTGLKDKNGEDIYEGDIVKFKHNAENVIGGQGVVGEVKYFIESLGFGFKTGEKQGDWWEYDKYDMFDFEVIGNIYENPELLTPNHNQSLIN